MARLREAFFGKKEDKTTIRKPAPKATQSARHAPKDNATLKHPEPPSEGMTSFPPPPTTCPKLTTQKEKNSPKLRSTDNLILRPESRGLRRKSKEDLEKEKEKEREREREEKEREREKEKKDKEKEKERERSERKDKEKEEKEREREKEKRDKEKEKERERSERKEKEKEEKERERKKKKEEAEDKKPTTSSPKPRSMSLLKFACTLSPSLSSAPVSCNS